LSNALLQFAKRDLIHIASSLHFHYRFNSAEEPQETLKVCWQEKTVRARGAIVEERLGFFAPARGRRHRTGSLRSLVSILATHILRSEAHLAVVLAALLREHVLLLFAFGFGHHDCGFKTQVTRARGALFDNLVKLQASNDTLLRYGLSIRPGQARALGGRALRLCWWLEAFGWRGSLARRCGARLARGQHIEQRALPGRHCVRPLLRCASTPSPRVCALHADDAASLRP
jgi:hypothetical protein